MVNSASKVVDRAGRQPHRHFHGEQRRGDPREFALVIPTPTILDNSQVNVAEPMLIEHLDAYTAPRLVEYFDPNPCDMRVLQRNVVTPTPATALEAPNAESQARAQGVKIESSYTVGEYDIQILSAEQSEGLLTFLTESGYKLSGGTVPALAGYLAQGMKFFVA